MRHVVRVLDSAHQIIAIGDFPVVFRVLRSFSFQESLHSMTRLVPVVILLVQDQPKFEAWIGTGDMDARLFTERDSFVVARMFVSVESYTAPQRRERFSHR